MAEVTYNQFLVAKDTYEELIADALGGDDLNVNVLNYLENVVLSYEAGPGYLPCIKAFRTELSMRENRQVNII